MNRSNISKVAALAVLAGLAVVLGAAVGGGKAAGQNPTVTGPMPVCDPGDSCTPTTTSSTTTATTTTTPTTPGSSTQCSDGRDNDADGFVDGNDPGCSSPQDNNEADDPPLEAFVGNGTAQFMRIDEGAVFLDSTGATVRCARLGAERSEHGFLSKGWSFFMSLRWCWNGKVITSWDSWDKWVKNHIPFPASLIYPLDWSIKSETPPAKGTSESAAFAQAKVQICPIKLPACFIWYPWLRLTIDAQGHAFCQSDVRNSIPDCKA